MTYRYDQFLLIGEWPPMRQQGFYVRVNISAVCPQSNLLAETMKVPLSGIMQDNECLQCTRSGMHSSRNGIVHSKLQCHPFTTHSCVNGSSGEVFFFFFLNPYNHSWVKRRWKKNLTQWKPVVAKHSNVIKRREKKNIMCPSSARLVSPKWSQDVAVQSNYRNYRYSHDPH